MTAQTRDAIFADLDEICRNMCQNKSADYAGKTDVLANFKRNAARLGMSPYQIWAVYFNKHIDSINNAIAANPSAPACVTEPLKGRIIDAIVYLKLLECLQQDTIVTETT